MRSRFRHIFCFVLLTILYTSLTYGQIYRYHADTVVVTNYAVTDSIHIFTLASKGDLFARSPDGSSATFEWSHYDPTSADRWISIPGGTSSNTNSTFLTGLSSGGYRVHITSPSLDQNQYFTAWIFIDTSLTVKMEKANNFILYNRYTCDYLDLVIRSAVPSYFTYYNPGNNQSIQLANKAGIRWSSKPDLDGGWYLTDTARKFRLIKERIPFDTTLFYANATDSYGLTRKDSAWYPPVLSKADFDTSGNPVVDEVNSAPFKVVFTNKSKNAAKYYWIFGDGTDSLATTSKNDTTHLYFKQGPYRVRLHTVSALPNECEDTTSKVITISPAKIGLMKGNPDMPNVFTPDGKFPRFKIYNVSIRHFRFIVFSRYGQKVYEKEGDDMLDWEGWDGVNSNGLKASEGIYFYVLEVLAWDKQSQNDLQHQGNYRGWFYLFRN